MAKINIEWLLRPNIRDLVPYSSARSEYTGKDMIYLDANENSFGSAAEGNYSRYPDPQQTALKDVIGKIKGVDKNRIFLGNGSDEPIDLLIRSFCEPGKDNILILPPTYGMYEVSARINDVAVKKVLLTNDFQVDVEQVLAEADVQTKLLFICSPNNPTGNLVDEDAIVVLLDRFEGIVILDEAYIDFAGGHSFADRLDIYNNLVILQTFSKAWGLAGLRLGMAFAAPEIIAILNKVKAPYNINAATQEIAIQALSSNEFIDSKTKLILLEREKLETELAEFSFVIRIFPSQANFLLVRVADAAELYAYLKLRGIIVRNRSKEAKCESCLRITVGTPQENNQLINALKQYSDE